MILGEHTEYFCEHCFEDENIKQYIRDNGKPTKEVFDCSFCTFETEVDIDECIDEYIQKCMEIQEEKLTKQDFEDRKIELYIQCRKKCKEKYKKICEDKYIETTYIIKKERLIQKFKEVILKLYSYDWNNNYDDMCHNATQNYCEGKENPESYANLVSINDLEGIEGKEEYRFSTLEEVLNAIGIDDISEEFLEIFHKYVTTPNEVYRVEKDGGTLRDWGMETNVWKNKCLYAQEQYKITLWRKFSEYTKYKARFFTHKDDTFSVSKELQKFNLLFKKLIVNVEERIYRARVIDSDKTLSNIQKNPATELGKAPKEIVKNNRFSPIGISYGYFAFDKNTALAEIRATMEQKIAIGCFELNKVLKLIDFSKDSFEKYINPFFHNFANDMYCESRLIKEFVKDISKPINDNEIEYIPTQILSEYIWSLGYDGFIFDSSQRKNGKNIVIFEENPDYIDFEIVKIISKDIAYTYEINQE